MNSFKVGAYIRLSKEDEKNKESESVVNQRQLIRQYLSHNGLKLNEEYVDDGYSGTMFDRPSFKRLLQDIEKGKINMVITKDLSRLGRDYIKSGYYIEEYFPNKKVRYVSILDNIDTISNSSSNDIAPFKALFNDMVSRDTSKKIKSILESKKRQGLYLGSSAPFGYSKNPLDKHRLIIDGKNSKVVKKIFNYFLNGKSINEIVDYLNSSGIASPSSNLWSYNSVYNILKNRVYTGVTIQNVWTNISYKNKKRVKRQESEWIINNNSHKAIISVDDFNLTSKILGRKHYKPIKQRPRLLLEGLVYCKECGKLLGANYSKKRNKWYLVCNGYKKNSHSCTSHYLDYGKLENEIVKLLNRYLDFNNFIVTNSKKVRKLKNKIKILYQDRLNNIISLEEYQDLKIKLLAEIDTLKNESSINISRDLIFLLIDKVTIDNDKNIIIKYKFKKPD